ncbi:MAG: hypothetical protein RTU92_14795 [Candidatus Thorarchaeota archaeon]
MAYLVYSALSGLWDWGAPYIFIVTVFRLLSFLLFFISLVIITGFAMMITGGQPNDLIVGLYNTLVLRQWYMQPYGVDGPLENAEAIFMNFATNLGGIIDDLMNTAFIFLYFICAGIGVALFLQSLYRMEHKYVGGAFISIQAILIIAAYQHLGTLALDAIPTDFVAFLTHSLQILALVSFAYIEISYQMIYSYSVGKPVEDREETLKKQLLALRQATRKQDAIERGERVSITGMSRSTGATAFSFLREAIERKAVGSADILENLDAVSDVRRLQHFVDELLASDPNARDELTAKAAAPSSSYVIGSTIMGSAFRFLSVVAISFFLLNPDFFVSLLSLPPGVANSAALSQPEIVLLFLVPIVLLFPFIAAAIGWYSRQDEEEELTKAQKEERKKAEKERDRLRKEAERTRRERERERGTEDVEPGEDEWDRVLTDTYGTDES